MDYALSCQVDGKTLSYPLHTGRNTLGRLVRSADIALNFDGVSRTHAAIDVDSDNIRIIDLQSKNGTFVNGARVQERILHLGDTIALGPMKLRFEREDAPHTPVIQKHPEAATADLRWSQAPNSLEESPRSVDGRSRLFNALLEFGGFLVSEDDAADIYRTCLKQVAGLFRFRRACLVVLNDGGTPDVRSCYPNSPEMDDLDEVGVSRTMIDEVVRERHPLLVGDLQHHSLSKSAIFKGIRSAVVVPLFDGHEVLGVLYMDHDREHAFGERHLQRLQLMGNLVAAKISQASTQKEMQGAAYIQSSMLCKTPAQPPGVQTAFRLEPSAAVGGDLYETLALPDGRYLYALGDVSGHQFDAAMAMANAMATLRALAPLATSPLQLVEDIQALISGQLPKNGFITLFLGFFDPTNQRFEYVNAGHDPPVLFLPGVAGAPATELAPTGPPVGMPIPVPLEAAHVELPAGALLCAWSDGIIEAARPGILPEQFSRERLVQLLTELREQPVNDIVDRVFTELKGFLGGTHIRDDCTMLVLRRS